MSGIKVEIVIQGLIALSPLFGADGANHITALAVDSRQAPPESVCIVEHKPRIKFPTTPQDCTASRTNGCQWDPDSCTCDLDRQEITLLPDADPNVKIQPQGPPRVLPFSNEEDSGGSFAYVANLSHMGYSLNSTFLEPSPPSILAARFQFPFESLLACDLSTRPEDLSANVHPLEFRRLGTMAQEDDLCQAAAQTLVAEVTLDSSIQPLILRLTKFDGSAEYEFPLIGPGPIRIDFTNHRPAELPLDDPCDDGVGRDFALFYELVNNPPAWNEREVPHVKYTLRKSFADVNPRRCDEFKTPTSRPICPLAEIE